MNYSPSLTPFIFLFLCVYLNMPSAKVPNNCNHLCHGGRNRKVHSIVRCLQEISRVSKETFSLLKNSSKKHNTHTQNPEKIKIWPGYQIFEISLKFLMIHLTFRVSEPEFCRNPFCQMTNPNSRVKNSPGRVCSEKNKEQNCSWSPK